MMKIQISVVKDDKGTKKTKTKNCNCTIKIIPGERGKKEESEIVLPE